MRKRIIGIALTVMLIISVCPGINANAAGSDSISIISVIPQGRIEVGVEAELQVTVDYSLESFDRGALMIGFNSEEFDSFRMISSENYIVSKGSGSHTFKVRIVPVDWGTTEDFKVYVNISEYLHESSWTPLGSDRKSILNLGKTSSPDNGMLPEQTAEGSGVAVSAGEDHSMAVKSDGSLWTWGSNYFGQLGNGTITKYNDEYQIVENHDAYVPQKIMDGIRSVSSGTDYSLALTKDNVLYAWGSNEYGQLGDGTTETRLVPTKIMEDVVFAEAGYQTTIVIKDDRSLLLWGGSIFSLNDEKILTPKLIMKDVKKASIGSRHLMILTDKNELFICGNVKYIGMNYTDPNQFIESPVKVMSDIEDISAGSQESYAINSKGELYSWGANGFDGQLGLGTDEFWVDSPLYVTDNVKKIFGKGHMLLKEDNSLWIWGTIENGADFYNSSGRDGGGMKIDDLIAYGKSPVKILDNMITAEGTDHYLAVDNKGNLLTWGNNAYGQLGNSKNTTIKYESVNTGEFDETMASIAENFQTSTPEAIMNMIVPGTGYTESAEGTETEFPESQIQSPYIYTESAAPSLDLDLSDDLHDINSRRSAVKSVQALLDSLSSEDKQSVETVDMVMTFIENAVSKASEVEVEGKTITLTDDLLERPLDRVRDAESDMDDLVRNSGISINRKSRTEIQLNSAEEKRVSVKFDESVKNIDADIISIVAPFAALSVRNNQIEPDLKVTIKDTDGSSEDSDTNIFVKIFGLIASAILILAWLFMNKLLKIKIKLWIVFCLCGLFILANAAMLIFGSPGLQASDAVSVELNKEAQVVLSLVPDNHDDPEDLIVVDEDGDPVVSKYNPITEMIEARINRSSTYSLKESSADFSDISDKSREMQDAIVYLAKRHVMTGTTENEFKPDDHITRADFVSVLVKALGLTDLNSDSSFNDLSVSDWYAGMAASAKEAGLVEGFADNSFDGEAILPKDQLVVLAARTLVTEMGYYYPENTEELLSRYIDRKDFKDWSEDGIALSTLNNIVLYRKDGLFVPVDTMTRGDAAIILKRVFDKIW